MRLDKEKDAAKFAQAVLTMQENMVASIEYHKLNARLTRAKYLALIANDFTESQALELCK